VDRKITLFETGFGFFTPGKKSFPPPAAYEGAFSWIQKRREQNDKNGGAVP
jgi:hypothetical protein